MKLSYEPLTHEPFLLRLTTEELSALRWHLAESVDKLKSKSLYFESMSNHDEAFKRASESTKLDLADANKLRDDLEILVKRLKY